jgi:twitching motility protein PilT
MDPSSSLTPQDLLTELLTQDTHRRSDIRAKLGPDAISATLFELENILISRKIVSNSRLRSLLAAASGLEVFDPETTDLSILRSIDSVVAKSAGALLTSENPLKIAFIEDTPINIDIVSRALGGQDFEVNLITTYDFKSQYKELYSIGYITVKEHPAVTDINELLTETIKSRSSDLHVSIGIPPMLRIDGRLIPLKRQNITAEWLHSQLQELAGDTRYKIWEERKDVDFAYQFGDNRFRCNLGEDLEGITLSARLLPKTIPTPDSLNMPKSIRDFIDLERGLVLITGPTGSGKSTTLATLLNQIALNQSRHIITLEDPVEFVLPINGKAHVNQRELGTSFFNFAAGLRQALRQDPDVILVGELRDQETMRTALTCAETGHLVFGTLHTYDTVSSVDRLVSSFSGAEQDQVRSQLAYILKGIVSQTLVPHASGRGRIAAYEIMITTPAIATNLSKQGGHVNLKHSLESGSQFGMQTMEMALASLVHRGQIREEEAFFRAPDKEDFEKRLTSINSRTDELS